MTTFVRPKIDTPKAAAALIETEMRDGCLNPNVIAPDSVVAEALKALVALAREDGQSHVLIVRTALLALSNWCRAQETERLESAADPVNTLAGAEQDRERALVFGAMARIADGFMRHEYPIQAPATETGETPK